APKNHFGDVTGLLSDLAAVGFERIASTMGAELREGDDPGTCLIAVGRGYVAFARAHPGLFQLMYRSERLDMDRPALRDAVADAARVLFGAVGGVRKETLAPPFTLLQAAHVASAWSLVHGFALLLLDGRMQRTSGGADPDVLLATMLDASNLK